MAQETPSPNTQRNGGRSEAIQVRRRRGPFLIGGTLVGMLVGDYAQDLAQWVVCLHSIHWAGDICDGQPRAEALMIGTFLSTVVGVLAAATASRLGEQLYFDTLRAVVGVLAGATMALLKASVGETGYPDPGLFGRPLFLCVCAAFLILLPAWILRPGTGKSDRIVAFHARIAVALLAGIFLGWTLQGVAETFWTGLEDAFSSAKFVVAPSVTVVAMSAWGTALLLPAVADWRPGWRWPLVLLVAAALLIAAYAGIFYFSRHGNGWLEIAGASRGATMALFLGLMMPPLLPPLIAYLISFRIDIKKTLVFGTLLAIGLILPPAMWCVQLRLRAEKMITDDAGVLLAAHLLVPAFTTAALLVTERLYHFLAEIASEGSERTKY